MKIGLVFNPFSYKLHEENLRIVQKYFGLFPPLSLAWVAAIAEQAGHEVILIDARTLNLNPDQTLKILQKFQPDMLGFMLTTYMFRETMEWAGYLKKQLNVPVVAGGYNMRVYPRESLMNDVFDFGCYKQALHMFPSFLECYENNGDMSEVPGLIFKNGDQILINPTHPDEENFDDFPNPARHLLPNELYAEFPTERKNFTVMVTSMGCPKSCTFCEAGGTKYAPRSAQTVVSEMEECYREYGIREIDIFDYEFTIMNNRTKDICDRIIEKDLDIIWACRSRIDSVNEELLKKMRRAGCSRIYYGIETGDQGKLDVLNKGIKIQDIRDTIRITNETGIKTLGFFLTGIPGETKESFKKLQKFSTSLGLHYAQFSKLTAKPLTGLWEKMVKDTGQDYWKEYILGNTEERQIERPWTELSNQQIDILTKKTYLKFYLNPGTLLKAILSVASLTEFKRKLRAMLDMGFGQEKVSENWFKKDRSFRVYNENSSYMLNQAFNSLLSLFKSRNH